MMLRTFMPKVLCGLYVGLVGQAFAASAPDAVSFIQLEQFVSVTPERLPVAAQRAPMTDLRVRQADWNGDGVVDTLLFRGPEVEFCGSGGCSYELYDGRSGRLVGEFFGTLIVHAQKINDWPVVTLYGHRSADAGRYDCEVFDGQRYVSVSAVDVQGADVEALFTSLRQRAGR